MLLDHKGVCFNHPVLSRKDLNSRSSRTDIVIRANLVEQLPGAVWEAAKYGKPFLPITKHIAAGFSHRLTHI